MPRKLTPLQVAKQSAEYLQMKVATLERQLEQERTQRTAERKSDADKRLASIHGTLEFISMLAGANTQLAASASSIIDRTLR